MSHSNLDIFEIADAFPYDASSPADRWQSYIDILTKGILTLILHFLLIYLFFGWGRDGEWIRSVFRGAKNGIGEEKEEKKTESRLNKQGDTYSYSNGESQIIRLLIAKGVGFDGYRFKIDLRWPLVSIHRGSWSPTP